MTQRGTLRISQQSRHYRLYQFWSKRAKHKTPDSGYKENLCHYTRVVLFWGPLSWFVNATPTKYKWLTPGIGVVGASAPVALAITSALFPGPALHVLAFTAGAMVLATLALGVATLVDDHPEGAKKLGTGIGIFLLWPLLLVIAAVLLVFSPRKSVFGPNDQALRLRESWASFGRGTAWLFTREIRGMWWWAYPLLAGLTMAAAVGVGFLFMTHPGLLPVALLIGLAFGVVTLLFLLLLVPLWDKIQIARVRHLARKEQERQEKREEKGDNVFSVFWAFLVAKKHRACPFIDVAE